MLRAFGKPGLAYAALKAKKLRFGICDFEAQPFAISFRDLLAIFLQNLRFSRLLIFIHLQCWEVLPFCRFQRQRCIKIRVLRAQDFDTPLALKTVKGQHLSALEVYKHQSPISPSAIWKRSDLRSRFFRTLS